MNILPLAFRTVRREWRLAELRTLALALVLSIVALGVVATLALRVEHSIAASSAELVGGDGGINAPSPIPAEYEIQAREMALATAHAVRFPSMAFAQEQAQLLNLAAVSPEWPLRGEITLRDADGRQHTAPAPQPGEIYLDARALAALGVDIGATVQIGDANLRIAGELLRQPDGGNVFALAPTALAPLADIERAGLLGPGSRARYSLLLAGAPGAVQDWKQWAASQALPDNARLIELEDAQQNLGGAFERANAFLRLCALLAALLAGVAIALASQRYAQRKTDEVALLRALGAPRADVLKLLAGTLAALALPAALLGIALTQGLSALAWQVAGKLFSGALPTVQPVLPSLAAAAMGLAILAGFALPPLARLADVPPAAVFRRSVAPRVRRFDLFYLLPLATALGLIWMQAGSARLAIILAISLAVVALVAAILALLALWLARRVAADIHPALRLGLASLARRRFTSAVQAVALSLGLCALLILAVAAPALLQEWRSELPDETPNWFALNVLEEQVPDYRAALEQASASQVAMLPLAVGKLTAINGEPAESFYQTPEQRERAAEQLRFSWSATLPSANRLVAGAWQAPEAGAAGLSVEKGWMERFGLKLGDSLTLESGGRSVTATIDSVREVDWSSFRVNFFLLLDPAHADGMPHTWIASYYLPPAQNNHLADMARQFPNVSMLDVNDLLERVRSIIERVSSAVSWVLSFSLLAGALVLAAALAASAQQRRHEAALLRTLGAQRRQLRLAALCEFLVLGLIAALTATMGAAGAGSWLGQSVFRMAAVPLPWAQLAGTALLAALVITLLGLAGTRRILNTPPMALLRAA
ncbi:FtsX-like permease family protein [Pseudomonas sp. S 311-6]|uniref:ABC transporter permease n=1 Tax=Kerstersia gyiorum TaxID=206506 RepID=UPI002097FE16|nr:FtsX-like permease family protein [Pseudomonas sp. S 311-6]